MFYFNNRYLQMFSNFETFCKICAFDAGYKLIFFLYVLLEFVCTFIIDTLTNVFSIVLKQMTIFGPSQVDNLC